MKTYRFRTVVKVFKRQYTHSWITDRLYAGFERSIAGLKKLSSFV